MTDEIRLLTHKHEQLAGSVLRRATETQELLSVALQALKNGRSEVTLERVEAAIADLEDLKKLAILP